MVFFMFLLLLIVVKAANVAPAGHFNKDYLSIQNSNIIKGIFVITVIFSHCSQYVTFDGIYDEPYIKFQGFIGQMIVAMFLFYSGYGVLESIQKKGWNYVKSIPTKRFFKVLVNFDIAVLLYLILDLILGIKYDAKTIFLSFIGWENIGNSNWYILAILALYLLIFVAFFLMKWFDSKPMLFVYVFIFTILTMGFVLFEMKMEKDAYYYYTTILFPLGCWYSLLKPYIDKIVMKNDIIYSFVAMLVGGGLFISYNIKNSYGIEGYSLWAIFFTISLVVFTMKFSFKSTILEWFGKHIFSVYILQRIPMMILNRMGISHFHKYFFIVVSFLVTVFIAQIFDYFTGLLWNKKQK